MKLSASLFTTAVLAVSAFGAPPDAAQLDIYPKNLARQHLGANLFHYTAATQSYTPTEAAAAWLDDDITTGWPLLAGKQYYLLALPEPELVTNFCVSARPATGTVTLYAGNEPAAPGGKGWSPLARDIPFASINEKKLSKPFSREAKYVLIETDVADPGPVYSLYLYGKKPAVTYNVQKREEPIDVHAIFGPYVNDQTSFNVAGLYAKSVVEQSDAPGTSVSWQKAIDDNPESGVLLPASGEKPGMVVRYESSQPISRIALLTDSTAKGKLDFYLSKSDVGTEPPPIAAAPDAAAPAAGSPTISIVLDGSNPRTSVDFPATDANQMAVRWTPEAGSGAVNLRELNAFGSPTLTAYTAAMKPEAVASSGDETGKAKDSSKDSSKDGKSLVDNKQPSAIAAGPQPGPYLPGALGFPPNILVRGPRVPNPVSP